MPNESKREGAARPCPLTDELEKGVQAFAVAAAVAQAASVNARGEALILCVEEQMWAFLDVTGELWEEQRLTEVTALLTTGGRPN